MTHLASGARACNAVAVLLALAFMLGCGAGRNASGQHGSTSTPADSQALAEAGSDCAWLNGALTTHIPAGLSRGSLARLVSENADLEKGVAAELDKLAVPASLRGTWKAMLADRRTLATELAEYASAKARGDESRAQALLRSKALLRRNLLETADAAGVARCAHVG